MGIEKGAASYPLKTASSRSWSVVGVSNPKSCPAIVDAVVRLLAQERAKQGMSMNKLAELTGLALTTISYFERGFRKPTLETALRVAVALDVDLGALIQRATKTVRSSAKTTTPATSGRKT